MKMLKTILILLIGCVAIIAVSSPAIAAVDSFLNQGFSSIYDNIKLGSGVEIYAAASMIVVDRNRAIYSRLKRIFMPGASIVPSYLRIENKLENSKSGYEFEIMDTQVTENPTVENRLNINDMFAISDLGLFIYQEDNDENGREPLQTYPNTTHFTGGSTFVPKDLETIYNGNLAIKVGSTVFLDSFDTRRLRLVPSVQEGNINAAAYDSATPADNTYSQGHSESNPQDGFSEMTPQIILDGRKKNEIKLTIPSFSGINIEHDGAGVQNNVVLYLRGYLIKNGKFRSRKA